MSSVSNGERPAVGLRERKKARTKAAIREHAMRLFQKQAYQATTVEQIAEAAEVSPSTFFRYFPTKEDVVLTDDDDPLILAAFRAQPAELSPVAALRAAMRCSPGSPPSRSSWNGNARRSSCPFPSCAPPCWTGSGRPSS